MFKSIEQGTIAIAILAVAAAIGYYFYSRAQVNNQNAASVALNNQYFQQQVQTQELQSITGSFNGASAATSGGIVATGAAAPVPA